MRTSTMIAISALGFALSVAGKAEAIEKKTQSADPYSIMVDDDERAAPVERPRAAPVRKKRIGSSSPPPPPSQSVVTPLGVAPRSVDPYPIDRGGSGPRVVPGQYGTVGPAVAPARPAGQSFQDRAVGCVHSGSSQGIGAGQIGSFTQGCVNQ